MKKLCVKSKRNFIDCAIHVLIFCVLPLFLFSCSFPFQDVEAVQITNISDNLSFQKISRQSFMGGSVFYNPDNPSSGQLANGVTIAVRLGVVDKEYLKYDEVIFTDKEDLARYGFIAIDFIDKNKICFTYFSYTSEGEIGDSNSFSIKRGEEIDINNDGFLDLKYDYPLKKRASFKNAVWLTFLSSEETLNTSMFAVLPEQYSRGVYPSGIMGINPYGKFIVNKYEVNSTNRAVVQGISYGDYILDSHLGEYQMFISNSSYKSSRTIDDSELQTISTIDNTNFYFSEKEFDEITTPYNLLSVLPVSVRVKNCLSEIDELNHIIENRNLLIEIANESNLTIDSPEIIEIMTNLSIADIGKVVEFNRYLLEAFFPEQTPMIDLGNNSISTIFPLLSVLISNPEDDTELISDENQRSVGTANNYREYLSQKNAIDEIFSEFYPIQNLSYDFPGWENLFKKTTNTQRSISDVNINKIDNLIGNVGTVNDVATVLKTTPKTNYPTKIDNNAKLKLGIMGHFKVSFSNIEGGIYAGVYVSADTSLDMSKILATYPVSNVPKISCSTEEKLLDIDLRLFNAPPINIGVVTFKFSLSGGIDIPAKVNLTGSVTTSLYAGFTGFYAAGFDAGANFGVKTKSVKLWKLTIKIPTGFYFNPYAKGNLINETAYYVGPISDVITIPGLKLQSGKLELCISPYVYVEPGITISNCLYGGIKIGPYLDLGCGLKFNVDDTQDLPKSLELYGIFGGGLGLQLSYGIDITIPIINKKIEQHSNIPIKTPLSLDREEYSLSKIYF